ncbi:hypothetical protein [Phenylobacterium deserti]|uniref:Uncharacterized protein n=1 Tax=Phenylobacterium deserti TaxID=1914756 RepID=A0A328AH07_9CAUL|nr:hypothetical protein [Phenylobacterium deserti]RAK52138.1 hypothetical protein DJ018_13360 [Phenylobacterium deserti]
MSDALSEMFTPDGFATPLLFARWRAKGATQPLQPALRCHEAGQATDEFRRLWPRAFPTKQPLPQGRIAAPDGRFTLEMFKVWA